VLARRGTSETPALPVNHMDTELAGLKRAACEAIDARRSDIIALGDDVFEHPEVGWSEHRTAGVVATALRSLGLDAREGVALTGVKAVARGAGDGPTVAILGELDGLPVPGHPQADPETGIAHACGHNAQLASMFGAAIGLLDGGPLRRLTGRVVFFAVPAEEYVQLEQRRELVRAGRIEFMGGKPELIRLGELDDVDIAMLVHASSNPEHRSLSLAPSSNGLVAKQARFVGRAAHAGAAPERGINALNAAGLALSAISYQRETFRDEDNVRVHPILTRAGDSVNIVPADVRLETFVRARTLDAIRDADAKVERALKAGAMAIGAGLELTTLPGYLPLRQDPVLSELFKANAIKLVGEAEWVDAEPIKASTDAGDLSHVMPLVHPSAGGCTGLMHGEDFAIADREAAYLNPAKAMAMTVIDLLTDDASGVRRLLDSYRPAMTKSQYLEFVRGLAREERLEVAG
jgi:amidohydrolase